MKVCVVVILAVLCAAQNSTKLKFADPIPIDQSLPENIKQSYNRLTCIAGSISEVEPENVRDDPDFFNKYEMFVVQYNLGIWGIADFSFVGDEEQKPKEELLSQYSSYISSLEEVFTNFESQLEKGNKDFYNDAKRAIEKNCMGLN